MCLRGQQRQSLVIVLWINLFAVVKICVDFIGDGLKLYGKCIVDHR